MILPEIISSLDLPGIMEAEGVDLHRSGNGYQFKCCFHDDHTPSGSLRNNGKWRFRCFGCNISGDAIDFIQKRHGIDFKGACRYLGIESGPLSTRQKAKIQKNKQRSKVEKIFKRWELAAIDELKNTIKTAYQISGRWKTIEDFEAGAEALEPIAQLQGQLDILMTGSMADRQGLYNRWKEKGGFF